MLTNKEIVGAAGEAAVLDYMITAGYDNPRLSSDKYDSTGDIYFSVDSRAEVKTKTIISKYNSFPLEVSQWRKADEADELFFVSVPMYQDESAEIYKRIDKNAYKQLKSFGYKKEPVRLYHLEDLQLLSTLDKQSSAFLYENSISTYRK